MNATAWLEGAAAVLLLASGLLSLVGAVGLLRLKDFFQRMHPPALAFTLGTWCAVLAVVLFSSLLASGPAWHALLIPVLLAIGTPVTTTLLARAALFRQREAAAISSEKAAEEGASVEAPPPPPSPA